MSDISPPTKGLYGQDKWTEEHEQVPKSVPGVAQGLGKTAWAFCLRGMTGRTRAAVKCGGTRSHAGHEACSCEVMRNVPGSLR